MRLGRPTTAERRELIARFFPPERTERTYGFEVRVEELWLTGDRPPAFIEIRVDELAQAPDQGLVDRVGAVAAALLHELGPVPGRPDVQVTANLTDEECRE
jgi:hypothetical protein